MITTTTPDAATWLTITGLDSTEISVVDQARAQRDELLEQAAEIETVVDQLDADAAASVLRSITGMVRAVEASRNDAKAPVLVIGKRIDALAKDLTEDLSRHEARISRVLGAFQAQERRKAAEARRKAAEEEERIKREAARRIQEAERNAATDDDAATHVAAIEEAATVAIVASRQAAENVASVRPDNTVVREEWKFEVVDIAALYAAAPHLVTLEPNGAAIRAVIKNVHTIPGLRIWKEAKTIIR